jgi:hypothetical protein
MHKRQATKNNLGLESAESIGFNEVMRYMIINEQLISGLYRAIIGIILVLLLGTIGYKYIENRDWIDAFYMTAITLFMIIGGIGGMAGPEKPRGNRTAGKQML